jgi:hypothetical protein
MTAATSVADHAAHPVSASIPSHANQHSTASAVIERIPVTTPISTIHNISAPSLTVYCLP